MVNRVDNNEFAVQISQSAGNIALENGVQQAPAVKAVAVKAEQGSGNKREMPAESKQTRSSIV